MSNIDKERFDALIELLEHDGEENDIVDKIKEMFDVFKDFPETENLMDMFSSKLTIADIKPLTLSKGSTSLSYNPSSDNVNITFGNNLELSKSGQSLTLSAIDTLYSAGTGLTKNSSNVFALKTAADTEIGGIQTGYTEVKDSMKYAVKLDNSKAYVKVD